MVTPDQNRAQADAWNPAQYERFRNERTQPFHDLVSLVEPLPGMRAIDLGCGTGELTRIMHDVLGCASTVGLDQSSAMLARTVGHASPDLTFVTGDIANLDPALGPFDLITSSPRRLPARNRSEPNCRATSASLARCHPSGTPKPFSSLAPSPPMSASRSTGMPSRIPVRW
ncbi:MAG: methyltransferase domain-containing protein [Proteobacteria bacterium]|nr:methyltransferase domain-containing protein [Pseudomonadota bacterium]